MKYLISIKRNDSGEIVSAQLCDSIDEANIKLNDHIAMLGSRSLYDESIIEVNDDFDVESYIFGDLDL